MGCMSSKRVIYVTPRPTQGYGGQPPEPERKFEIIDEDWDRQSPTQIVTEMCGFVTILSGTFLLHKTKDMVDGLSMSPSIRLHRHTDEEDGFGMEGIPLRRQETSRSI